MKKIQLKFFNKKYLLLLNKSILVNITLVPKINHECLVKRPIEVYVWFHFLEAEFILDMYV